VNRKTEMLDYDEIKALALKTKPRMVLAGASAYPRTMDFKRFREIADSVGAYLFVDIAHIAGLVATGLHPSPVPARRFCDDDDAQDPAGPSRRDHHVPEGVRETDRHRGLPGRRAGPSCTSSRRRRSRSRGARAVLQALPEADPRQREGALGGTRGPRYRIVSGGTDTHLFLVDLTKKGISGRDAARARRPRQDTVNKNLIPFDTKPSAVASGIRWGRPR